MPHFGKRSLARGGDKHILRLRDNGGVWVQHNDWLAGHTGAVQLVATDNNQGIRLEQAARADGTLWKSILTTLTLAQARGFEGNFLSSDHPVDIPVRIVSVE